MDEFEKDLKNQMDEAIAQWGSANLVRAWWILKTPNYMDGEPVLDADDIEQLSKLVIKLRDEIKALKND